MSVHPPAPDDSTLAGRYARRPDYRLDPRYDPLAPYVMRCHLERLAATARALRQHGAQPLDTLSLLDVGCGGGNLLLDCLRLGFAAERLTGIDLLDTRLEHARSRLPNAVTLHAGDATTHLAASEKRFDVISQSLVFSSVLEATEQQALARAMVDALNEGGCILWYDFTVNNPRNRDVTGVPVKRMRQLFPMLTPHVEHINLAPPLGRPIMRHAPWLYAPLYALRFTRTHALCRLAR